MEGFEIQNYCDCGLKCQVYKNWLELNKGYFKK